MASVKPADHSLPLAAERVAIGDPIKAAILGTALAMSGHGTAALAAFKHAVTKPKRKRHPARKGWKRATRKCRRSGCDRPVANGWTHCKRHYSAGRRFAKAEGS
jgi:hypothetical protein